MGNDWVEIDTAEELKLFTVIWISGLGHPFTVASEESPYILRGDLGDIRRKYGEDFCIPDVERNIMINRHGCTAKRKVGEGFVLFRIYSFKIIDPWKQLGKRIPMYCPEDIVQPIIK